ncbi:hypothetical protein BURMUCGD1_2765 [Burkholderia multivorans CGD1]|nr:hypothetical protein BURMUCGD1_2765 [Burkholderia multivorans CGD1]
MRAAAGPNGQGAASRTRRARATPRAGRPAPRRLAAAGTNPCDTFQRQSAKLPYRRPSAACPTVRNPPQQRPKRPLRSTIIRCCVACSR